MSGDIARIVPQPSDFSTTHFTNALEMKNLLLSYVVILRQKTFHSEEEKEQLRGLARKRGC